MADRVLTNEQILTILSGTPVRITELTAGLMPAQLRAAPSRGEWSVNEVLAHLRACADVWGECILIILREDHPTLRAVNPRSWIVNTDYPGREFQPSLDAFAVQREDLMGTLRRIAPEAWTRSATVVGAGKPLEWSVHFYAQRMARHERSHIKQIERITAALRG